MSDQSGPVRAHASGPGIDEALPGPPEPWTATTVPSSRPGPPFHMTEMIEAEPALARRVLGRLAVDPAVIRLADAIRHAAESGGLVLTGCGTSEHAALAAAEILRGALRREGLGSGGIVQVRQAFELALDPPSDGLVLAVSHEGATWATNLALSNARAAGARTALITVTDRATGAGLADPGLVIATAELDQSWCHTVGYLSPILVAAAVGGRISGRAIDGEAVGALLDAGLALADDAQAMAGRMADATGLVVIASGVDRPAGRELVLKVEEASWLPAAFRDLETMLHGHLPATDGATALVLLLADRDHRAERVGRARQLLRAAAEIGLRSGAIFGQTVAGDLDPALLPAGTLVVPEPTELPGPEAAILGTAVPLQLLAERLARARRTDPDPIRRDDPRYRAAAEVAEG